MAPNPSHAFLRLTRCGNDSREEKTRSILHTLCKGERPSTFTHIDLLLILTDSKAVFIVGGLHLSLGRKLRGNSLSIQTGLEYHRLR